MNNLLNALVINEEAVLNAGSSHALLSDKDNEVKALSISRKGIGFAVVKNIGMFIAAPFIALGFVIALPLIGLYHFAKLVIEAGVKNYPVAGKKVRKIAVVIKNVGLFFASPFIALAYIIALPFVGFFMIAKMAKEAYAKRSLINA